MKAKDVMTADPTVVLPGEPLSRAAAIMRDKDVGIVPVVEDRESMKLKGVITDRDIAIRHVAEKHGDDCEVGAHLTGGPIDTVRPDADLDEVTRLMQRDQLRRIPVVDESNRLVGIIAQADVALGGSPREQVGKVVEKISEPERRRS